MFITILYILIILSVISLAAMTIGKMPTLSSLSDEEIAILSNKKGVIGKCREINFRQHFFNFIVGLEKFLRRTKIVFLKIENALGKLIKKLSEISQIMAHKSREWIKRKEAKKLEKKNGGYKKPETPDDIIVVAGGKKATVFTNESEQEGGLLSFSELEKPTREEQRWIDLIVENPKNITAYKFLGLLYWKQHNYADAKASLEMAVKLGSRDRKIQDIIKEIKEKEKEV